MIPTRPILPLTVNAIIFHTFVDRAGLHLLLVLRHASRTTTHWFAHNLPGSCLFTATALAAAATPLTPLAPQAILPEAILDSAGLRLSEGLIAAHSRLVPQLPYLPVASFLPHPTRGTAATPVNPLIDDAVIHGGALDALITALRLHQRKPVLAGFASELRVILNLAMPLALASATGRVAWVKRRPRRETAIDIHGAAGSSLLHVIVAARTP